ncbi:MAG: hypothetical protein ABL973_20100 [Micropepsaceae bacterium]
MATVIAVSGMAIGGCQTINSITGSNETAVPASTPAQEPPVQPAPPGTSSAPVAQKANGLTGLDGARVVSLWGEPTIRRRDIGSELWTYNKGGSKCSVLLYVYPSTDGGMTVLRSEAVPGGASEDAVAACARTNDLPSVKPVS